MYRTTIGTSIYNHLLQLMCFLPWQLWCVESYVNKLLLNRLWKTAMTGLWQQQLLLVREYGRQWSNLLQWVCIPNDNTWSKRTTQTILYWQFSGLVVLLVEIWEWLTQETSSKTTKTLGTGMSIEVKWGIWRCRNRPWGFGKEWQEIEMDSSCICVSRALIHRGSE